MTMYNKNRDIKNLKKGSRILNRKIRTNTVKGINQKSISAISSSKSKIMSIPSSIKHISKDDKVVTIPISGMHCASCALSIEKSLRKAKGIKTVNVNYAVERATIHYNPKEINESDIRTTINSMGYKVITLEDLSLRYQNFPKQHNIRLKVLGMHSPHCVSIIEKALKNLSGIKSINLNYQNERADISFDPSVIDLEAIKKIIKDAGYTPIEETKDIAELEKDAREKEIKELRIKFIAGAILSTIILTGSFPEFFPFVPKFLNSLYVLLILTTPVQFWVGSQFYKSSWFALKNKTADMNTLIAIGTSAAYFYSTLVTIFTDYFISRGSIGVYYDTAAIIITLIILGRYIEAIAKGKTSAAIKKLMQLQPKTAIIIRSGRELKVSIDDILVGDIVIVKPGEKFPVDGIVVEGISYADESMISGESKPVEKKPSAKVIGATINGNGLIKFRAEKVGKDTMLSQIIRLVEEAQGSKAPIQRIADTVSSYFVPIVILIAVLTFVIWYFSGSTILSNTPYIAQYDQLGKLVFSLTIFIAVLIIACPCALGLATPTAIMVGTGKGAEKGILIKSGEALEIAYKLNTIIFDKTGTLTKGKPEVTDIFGVVEEKRLLQIVASAEKGSEHPIGQAVVNYAKTKNIAIKEFNSFKAVPGKGIKGKFEGKEVIVGSPEFLKECNIDISYFDDKLSGYQNEGKTVVIVAYNKKAVGIVTVADTLKENAKEAVTDLQRKGIEVYMITGDNRQTAEAIGSQLSIDKEKIMANVLPEQKENKVKELKAKGKVVAMVGDGINDAPALAAADLGIAIGSGTDIALETGNIVLVKNDLRDVISAIELSRYTIKKIKQNLFWAFIYNIIGIPVAAGVLFPLFGFLLSPVIAASAMAFSSISVVLNSLLMRAHKI